MTSRTMTNRCFASVPHKKMAASECEVLSAPKSYDLGENCQIEATVVTGLESIAKAECSEKLGAAVEYTRGRIFFDLPLDNLQQVWKLKGVDNIYVVLQKFPQLTLLTEKEDVEARLVGLVGKIHWATGLEAWRRLVENPNDLTVSDFLGCDGSGDARKVPKFRVTCNRSGTNHKFTSMEAAAIFGGAINDTFHWGVDMKNFDVEVVLNIAEDQLYVCLGITRGSLHHRNLNRFGPTSLRCTIAYNMLRLCDIKTGDIVCDPMCGGGSIPIEATLNWPDTLVLCGDHHHLAVERTSVNLAALRVCREKESKNDVPVDLQQWDVTQLPLRDSSVDVIVSDLPFGKRMGSRPDNRVLYPKLLAEVARVCRPGIGRAILLTQDKKSLSVAVGKLGRLWRQTRVYGVNMGGLAAAIFVLQRTNNAH